MCIKLFLEHGEKREEKPYRATTECNDKTIKKRGI